MSTPTELYLVRHAIAAERGMNRFKDAVKGLRRLDVAVDEIFTSPLVRARQTAEILAAGLDGKPPIKVLDALSPGHTSASVMTHLARVAKRRRIALVGHEPELGELAAHLIGAGRALAFKKGGICRIDLGSLTSKRAASLTWFLPPNVLRQVKR